MPQTTNKNQVRIIGGRWRGRKLHFPDIPELRPTPDRVRETLFNWLTPYIKNAHCLDLFAGSGALGLEALSRGANFVLMLDSSSVAVANLQKNISSLGASPYVKLYNAKFPNELITVGNHKFNIIFLDPPFHQNWIPICCNWLREKNCLAPDALVYVEAERELNLSSILKNWRVIREGVAGQVKYYLIDVQLLNRHTS